MEYTVHCECGKAHPVAAKQAGSEFRCDCGRCVVVPRLSQLRIAAGQSAVPLNAVEIVEGMLRNGELPSNTVCPLSGKDAEHTVMLHVQCEEIWLQSEGRKGNSLLFLYNLLIGWWLGAAVASEDSGPVQQYGRNTSVTIPIRISEDQRTKILKTRDQQVLKSLLNNTPAYAKMLEEYPDAEVTALSQ